MCRPPPTSDRKGQADFAREYGDGKIYLPADDCGFKAYDLRPPTTEFSLAIRREVSHARTMGYFGEEAFMLRN